MVWGIHSDWTYHSGWGNYLGWGVPLGLGVFLRASVSSYMLLSRNPNTANPNPILTCVPTRPQLQHPLLSLPPSLLTLSALLCVLLVLSTYLCPIVYTINYLLAVHADNPT